MISNAIGRKSNRIDPSSRAVSLKSVLVVLSLIALCAPTTNALASPFLVEPGGTTRTTFNLSGGFAPGTTLTSINGVYQYGQSGILYGSVTTGASTYGFLGSYLGNGQISNVGPLGVLPAGASASSFVGIYSSWNMNILPGNYTDGNGSHPFVFESGATRTTFNLSGGFAPGTTLSSINGVDQYGRLYGSVTKGGSTYGFLGSYLGNGQISNAGPLGVLPVGASASSFAGIYSSGNMTFLPGNYTDGNGSHPFVFEAGSGTTRTTFNLSGGFAPGTTLSSINGVDQYGRLYGSVTKGGSTYGFLGIYLGNGQISNAGPLGILPAGATSASFSGIYSLGGATILTGNYTVAAVPEPETYAMFLAGLAIFGVAVRRRKHVG